VDDELILYGFVAGFTLNAILAAQMVYYWNRPGKSTIKKGKQREVAVASATGSSPPKGKSPSTRQRG
jgi:mannose-P-dolichol utilization defect protein 1